MEEIINNGCIYWKTCKKKKTIVDYLIYVAVVVISIPALIATFYIPVIKHIPFIFVVGILYLAYQLILSRSVEYEYAVTNAYVDR